MNPEIEAFLFLAPDLGWLTRRQGEILREMCGGNVSVDEFVDLVVRSGLGPDAVQVRDFMTRMSGEMRTEEEKPVPEETVQPVSPDIDWFCSLAVSDGLLTRDTCLGLLTCFEDTTDLMSMAQFLVTSGFCDDVVRLQRLVDQATGASLGGQRPSPSVFAIS